MRGCVSTSSFYLVVVELVDNAQQQANLYQAGPINNDAKTLQRLHTNLQAVFPARKRQFSTLISRISTAAVLCHNKPVNDAAPQVVSVSNLLLVA